MQVPLYNQAGQQIGTTELNDNIFGIEPNKTVMHQALIRQLANARQGTSSTKTRGEVAGGGIKPFKQKGTGRARQGSRRAAQWVGGGRIHTPHPRSYEQRMPKKMRQAALRSALSAKAADAGVVVIDEFSLSEAKTKVMVQALKNLVGTSTALVLLPEKGDAYDLVTKTTNNLGDTKVLLASYLNIRDLFGYDKLILPVKALDALVANLG